MNYRTILSAAAITAISGAAIAGNPAATKPELTIRPGTDFGVAPAVVVPLPNGGKVEFKGPSLHPQVPPSFNGGTFTVTVPWPQGKK